MADIQFKEELQYQQPIQQVERKSFLFRLVLATGIVSTDRQAEYVLLGVAIVGIIITVWFLFVGDKPATLSNTDIQRIIQLQQDIQPSR